MKNDIFKKLEDVTKKTNDCMKDISSVMSDVDPSVRKQITAVMNSFHSNSTNSEMVIKDILNKTTEKIKEINDAAGVK